MNGNEVCFMKNIGKVYRRQSKIEPYPNQSQKELIDKTLEQYFEFVGDYPTLTVFKEQLLIKWMQCGDQYARELLIRHNLKLVVNIAVQYSNHEVQLEDLIQEGTVGLITAIDKFDTSFKTRISTYATYWITQTIQRYLSKNKSIVHLSEHIVNRINKVNYTQKELEKALGRNVTVEEIATYQDFSPKYVNQLMKLSRAFVTYDKQINEYGESALDLVLDNQQPTPEDLLCYNSLLTILDDCLDELTNMERQVIELRFGLIDGKAHTLEETGRHIDVTRERIRQIEAKALRKLRHPSRSKRLKDFLYSNVSNSSTFIGFAWEDYSTPQYQYHDDIYRRWKLRGFNIIEESPLSHSIICKLRLSKFQVLEQLSSVRLDQLKFLSKQEKIELIYYLEKINIYLADFDQEKHVSINDYFKEVIRCKECGASLDEGNWSLDKELCNSCRQRFDRIYGNRDFNIVCKTVTIYEDDIKTLTFNADVIHNNKLIHIENSLISSSILIMSDNAVIFSNEISISNTENENTSNKITKSSLCIKWSSDKIQMDKDVFIHVLTKDTNEDKSYIFVFKLKDESTFFLRNNYNIQLYDVIDNLNALVSYFNTIEFKNK